MNGPLPFLDCAICARVRAELLLALSPGFLGPRVRFLPLKDSIDFPRPLGKNPIIYNYSCLVSL